MKISLTGAMNDSSAALAAEFIRCASSQGQGPALCMEHGVLTDRGIPSVTVYAESSARLPLVLLLHGRTGTKADMLPYAVRLARAGFMAVAIDARLHGEWQQYEFKGDGVFDNAVIQAAQGTLADISHILDFLGNDPRVDISRVGMSGYSMGGTITLLATLGDRRIKAAAPMITPPDTGYFDAMEGMDAEFYSEFQKFSPMNNLARFYPTALLMQNGEADPLVPVRGPRRFSEEIQKHYSADPGRYRYIEYPGAGHHASDEMVGQAVEWFRVYL